MKKIFAFVVACVLAFILCCPFVSAVSLSNVVEAPTGGQIYNYINLKLYTPYYFQDEVYTPWYSLGHEFIENDPYFFYVYLKSCGLVGSSRVSESRILDFYNGPVADSALQGVFMRLCNIIYYSSYVVYDGSNASTRIWLDSQTIDYVQQFIDMYCDYYSIEGDYVFPFKGQQYSDTWYNSDSVIYLYLIPDKSQVDARFNLESAELISYEEYAQSVSTNLVSWWDNLLASINIVQLTSWLPSAMGTQIVVTFTSFMALIVVLIVLKTIHG